MLQIRIAAGGFSHCRLKIWQFRNATRWFEQFTLSSDGWTSSHCRWNCWWRVWPVRIATRWLDQFTLSPAGWTSSHCSWSVWLVVTARGFDQFTLSPDGRTSLHCRWRQLVAGYLLLAVIRSVKIRILNSIWLDRPMRKHIGIHRWNRHLLSDPLFLFCARATSS